MPPPLSLALLGPFDIRLDHVPVAGFEYNKVRALLAYLAVEAGQPHTRAHVCALLWPNSAERAARQSLSQALTKLRQALGDAEAATPFVLATPEAVQLNPSAPITVDVEAFATLVQASEAHAPEHRGWHLCTPCAARLSQAAALYRGDFLAQFFLNDSDPLEEWALVLRERYRQRMLSTLDRLAQYAEWRGAYDRAAELARRQVDLEPLFEVNHRGLMRRLALARQHTAALAQYQALRRLLAAELEAEPEPETTALYDQIKAGAYPGAAEDLRRVRPLPLPSARLIGREHDMRTALDFLEQPSVRALTLIGPPGIGKTRLALELAHALRYDFEDSACFVDLTEVSDASQVLGATARALGLREATGRSLSEALPNLLARQHLLLVLDNFEHVIEAAPAIAELLAACPGLKVLATSRTPLHIRAEQQYLLAPLALPDAGDPPEVMATAPAVTLFVERVQAVRPGFALTDDQAGAVLGLCAQLDGLPLAIELIAARAKTLAPADLLRQLERGLNALGPGSRDLPERQRTLSRSIAWSYDRLSAKAQRVFAALGVFTGGCTAEAVQAAVGPDVDVLPELETLVESSLIQAQPAVRGTRFTLFETLRAYALEQLRAAGEVAAAQQRHAEYFRELAERAEPELVGPDQKAWFDDLELDFPNLRAALSWGTAVNSSASLENSLRLATALEQFWEVRGLLREGRRWLETILASPQPLALKVRARGLRCAGRNAIRAGELRDAERWLRASVELFQHLEDELGLAYALNQLGVAVSRLGDAAAAQGFLEQALALAEAGGSNYVVASTLNALAENAGRHGEEARGMEYTRRALALNQARGDPRNTAGLLLNYGLAHYDRGDFAAAREHVEASLAAARELDDRHLIYVCLLNLGSVLLQLGEPALARERLEESIARARAQHNEQAADSAFGGLGRALLDLGDLAGARAMQQQALRWRVLSSEPRTIAVSFANIARVDQCEQRSARAAQLLAAADAIRTAIGAPISSGSLAEHDRLVDSVRSALGEGAFAAAWAAGQALTQAEAVALALEA